MERTDEELIEIFQKQYTDRGADVPSLRSIQKALTEVKKTLKGFEKGDGEPYTDLLVYLCYFGMFDEFNYCIDLGLRDYVARGAFCTACYIYPEGAKRLFSRFQISRSFLFAGIKKVITDPLVHDDEGLIWLIEAIGDFSDWADDIFSLLIQFNRVKLVQSLLSHENKPQLAEIPFELMYRYSFPKEVVHQMICLYVKKYDGGDLACVYSKWGLQMGRVYEAFCGFRNISYRKLHFGWKGESNVETLLSLSVHDFSAFSQEHKIMFLYCLEVAKNCICLPLPPCLVREVLEYARPLAASIIPYLAKVYVPKRVKTRTRGEEKRVYDWLVYNRPAKRTKRGT